MRSAYANADALGDGFDIDSLIDSFGDTKVITHVHVSCVPGTEDAFAGVHRERRQQRSGAREPALRRASRRGRRRARFCLSVYESPEAAAAHKKTSHYAEWREEVQDMMAEPRRATLHVARFPRTRGVGRYDSPRRDKY